ncbi:MAG: SGNH/GDSL hydrolase family protein [bacterium]
MSSPGSASAPTLVFIGDSITEAGRDRSNPDDVGHGWVRFVATALADAAVPPQVVNRGIGGNRVSDLGPRWSADCIDLAPALVTVQIGVNDTWRRYDGGEVSEIVGFTDAYRELLERVRDDTDAGLVLVEPFFLPMGSITEEWHEDLDPRVDAVGALAERFGARCVPLSAVLTAAGERAGSAIWTTDGVHPTAAGHALIAAEWLAATAYAEPATPAG